MTVGGHITKNNLIAAIYKEMTYLSVITPTNPMHQSELIRRAKETEERLPRLADVLFALVPYYGGGGLADALDAWGDYCQRFPRAGRALDMAGGGDRG
ncbi:hypothetical protein GCM10022198_00380 [Klugiella xanthotipulae]|uniref:Uncharacterized protein n=1 Tax=Klugiella xanthotipulae TaxID=244735 RepID=A0A543I5I2_9MICO|nr:hypothetical protein FB466_0637 [Klugiella xanthotipulae]